MSVWLPWLLAGLAIGWVTGMTQRWTGRSMDPDAPYRALAWMVGGALVRWILALGFLLVASRQGLPALLSALLGLWVTRWTMILRLHAGKAT